MARLRRRYKYPANEYIWTMSFSPDGKTLAAGNAAGMILLWNLERLSDPPVNLAEFDAGIWSLAFSPDGQRLAVGATKDDTVHLLDLASPNMSLKFGATDMPALDYIEINQGSPGGVPVAFSPDGTTLAAGSYTGIVRLWDVSVPTKPIQEYHGHEGPVWSIVFSSDGASLASGGEDATVRVWDVSDAGAPPRVLRGHSKQVVTLAFGPDDDTLASGGIDPAIRLWDLRSPDGRAAVLNTDSSIRSLSVDLERMRLVAGIHGQDGLRLWDLRSSGQPRNLFGNYGASKGLAFSPDGLSLGSAVADEVIQVWNLNDLSLPPDVLRGHRGEVRNVAFSSDGSLLSSTGQDHTVRVWRLDNPSKEIAVLSGAKGQWTAPFSPDANIVAIADWDSEAKTGSVNLWNIKDLKTEPVVVRTEMKRWINEITFSLDGGKLAATGREGIIHVEDLGNQGTGGKTLRGHEGMIWSIAFSPDGKHLASGGRDRTVRLWDLEGSGAPSLVLGRHDDAVLKVRFSPDGKYLVSSSKDKSIRLWNLTSVVGTPPVLLYGQEDAVWALAISPDSEILASGGGDKGILLWDLTHPVNMAPLEELVDLICKKVWRNLTIEEWREFVSEDLPYERTCPNLPAHPSAVGDSQS